MQTNGHYSPEREQKKEVILEKALVVFAREGYPNTDVQVIADLAHVGKGTVYRHFGNKAKLFLATAKHCLDEVAEYVRGKVGTKDELPGLVAEVGASEFLRRVALACAEYYEKNPQAVEIMIQERAEFRETVFPSHLMYRAETRSGIDQLIQSAIEQGELRNVDVTEATNAFADLLYGSVVNGCLEGGHTRLVERVSHAIDLYLNGLVA